VEADNDGFETQDLASGGYCIVSAEITYSVYLYSLKCHEDCMGHENH